MKKTLFFYNEMSEALKSPVTRTGNQTKSELKNTMTSDMLGK